MDWMERHNSTNGNNDRHDAGERTSAVALEAGLTFALCAYFASLAPRELVVGTLSSFLMLGALITLAGAIMVRDPVWAEHLTHWDVAAGFMALGIVLSWTIDPETVRAYFEANGAVGGDAFISGRRP